MSGTGALISLDARGAQDIFIQENFKSYSSYKSRYSRFNNFSQKPEQINFPTNSTSIKNNTLCVVEIPRRADLITQLWLESTSDDLISSLKGTLFEFYIGGQLIDSQTFSYMSEIWQIYMAENYSKSQCINNLISQVNPKFFPLHFFFCDNEMFLPLVALQYHKVEIRIKWGDQIENLVDNDIKLYGNYIYVEKPLRNYFAQQGLDFLITQVQRVVSPLTNLATSQTRLNMRMMNHPVKAIFFGFPLPLGTTTVSNLFTFDTGTITLNSSSIFSKLSSTYFSTVQGYYQTENANLDYFVAGKCPAYTRYYMYSFGNKVNSYNISGTCNFSRISNSVLELEGVNNTSNLDIYGVNYNVLRIQSGMGSLVFSN